MKDYLQTVTGPVAREDMGLTLPHEHLFNDLSSVVDAPCYPFSQRLVDKKVTAEIQWALKHDPYCCADNMDRKPIEDVIFEINNFISLGGRTIVDATGSESIGRDAQALREVALKTGLNIVASSGPYLEKFESQRIHKTVDELATTIDKELNQGIGDTDIRAGMIGEIGVSPTFTEAEHNSLRAASLAQINNPHVAMNIHMPGWLRRGDEVLDIVLGEMGVSPNKVSLAHSDPSGKDVAYQRKMLDKGVWLEFDMIGLDITFPKEGINDRVSSLVSDTARLAHYSADTREQLLTLADQVHHKLNHLEEKLHRVDQVQRAQLHLEQIFSWWSAGRYASFSPAGRCYVALEELRWGAFGDVIRQSETGQVNQLLDILRHKALTQMAQESGGSATVRLNTLDWLGGQGREQADNEWHDAINWLGDWCSEEQHPVIWSTTQAAEHLPVRMPRLCSAERLSESMVDEIFQKGAA
ncbi:hypothetical protein HN009_08585 [Escherichia coli]|nr:hypothetical protein [Escherichia coli]